MSASSSCSTANSIISARYSAAFSLMLSSMSASAMGMRSNFAPISSPDQMMASFVTRSTTPSKSASGGVGVVAIGTCKTAGTAPN